MRNREKIFRCYIPLELRFDQIPSNINQTANFYIPSTGATVQTPLIADGGLYMQVYAVGGSTSGGYIVAGEEDLTQARPDRNLEAGTFLEITDKLGQRKIVVQTRMGFDLNQAKGQSTADPGATLQRFWRNDRSSEKGRSNLNRLIIHAANFVNNQL